MVADWVIVWSYYPVFLRVNCIYSSLFYNTLHLLPTTTNDQVYFLRFDLSQYQGRKKDVHYILQIISCIASHAIFIYR